MKTKIFVIATLLVSIAMFSTGAFAYFSASQTITGSKISSGTMGLVLANNCITEPNNTSWGSAASAWNFENMVPGDVVNQTICMKITGNADAGKVYYDWASLLQTPGGAEFAKKLIIVSIQDNDDAGNQVGVFNSVGINTLYDLASLDPNSVWSATYVYPYLTVGEVGWMSMELVFDPNADDTFQGKTITYDLVIKATQKTPAGN